MIEKWPAKGGAGLRPARAISVSFNAGAGWFGRGDYRGVVGREAAVVDGKFVVLGGVLSGFVLVVLMQVVGLIGVRVGDRCGGRWLRHREGAGG